MTDRARLLLVALTLPACKGDKGEDPVVFEPPSWLSLDADGTPSLLDADGQVTFAMAPGVPMEARTVGESVIPAFGMWLFEREETLADELVFLGASGDETEVTLDYDLASGLGTASLRIAPEGEATVFTLSVDGPDHTMEGPDTVLDALAVPVACDPDVSFHGWGEQYNATEQTGEAFMLFVSEQGIGRDNPDGYALAGDEHTTYFPMPWYLDGRGFGVLF